MLLSCVQNYKILDPVKLKAFADYKYFAAQMMISLFDRVQNIAGKRKKDRLSGFFLLCPQCFPRAITTWDCVVDVN